MGGSGKTRSAIRSMRDTFESKTEYMIGPIYSRVLWHENRREMRPQMLNPQRLNEPRAYNEHASVYCIQQNSI